MQILALILFSISYSVNATVLGCLHHSYCRLINDLVPNEKVENLLPYNFNPHHFNPDISVTKRLTTKEQLILPPADFFHAGMMIEKKREASNSVKTFIFKVGTNGTIYSHFWFYPDTYCSLLRQAEEQLTAWGYKPDLNTAQAKCLELKMLVDKLKTELLVKREWVFIIDHEVLSPYFEENKIVFLNLHNVTEGGEFITPKQIKFLEELKTQKKKSIWITTEIFSVAGLDKYKRRPDTYEINLTSIDNKQLMNDTLAYTKFLIEELKKL